MNPFLSLRAFKLRQFQLFFFHFDKHGHKTTLSSFHTTLNFNIFFQVIILIIDNT